jgi:protoheme IX farnesyltransferase
MSSATVLMQNAPESRVRDYISLLKPRVMLLVVITGWVGLMIAPGSIHPLVGFIAVLAIATGSGAAGAINMWYDRDIDPLMSRTKLRPIPSGKIDAGDALDFAVVLATLSVVLMWVAVGVVSALLLLLAIAFYVGIYTMWLKRRTQQNIVIGGAAGAFPPMIGWAAVTQNITIEPLLLFAIIFMWTPPHFWALSLYRAGDYAKAGIPMMPVVSGHDYCRRHMFVYTVLLFVTSLLPVWVGMSHMIYLGAALLLGGIFLMQAWQVWRHYTEAKAKAMFGFSILYLFLLFAALLLDHSVPVAWFGAAYV